MKMGKNPIACITMENNVEILIELIPEEAPNTVKSFIYLAQKGCFDNYAIQRVVPGYVVDISYSAFGKEACKFLIANESISHGYANKIEMKPGVIAMGGYQNGIAGGEFFFPLAVNEKLTGNYPAFGKIIKGMEEIRRWEKVELKPVFLENEPDIVVNEPKEAIIIKKVEVDTFGISYDPPEKLEGVKLPLNWN